MLLENVGHILSKEMLPVMEYLLEDRLCVASVFQHSSFNHVF